MTGPAGQDWAERWPLLAATVDDERCANAAEGNVPCYNVVANNTFCETTQFIDASPFDTEAWHSVVENNSEIPCRRRGGAVRGAAP